VITIGEYAGREVAVFGLGRTGLTAARALSAGGARVLAWDDEPKNRSAAEAAGVSVTDINARDWRDFAALILSPGVPLTHPRPHRVVDLAQAVGVPILGDVELFARAVNAIPPAMRPKVIGVTGTNGKSTTSALIAHILKECGKDARLGGNIGRAVLDLEPIHAGAHYVLELSSYQLDLTKTLRCDVAVWLNLSPDHLDRHGDMAGYLAAKKRILRNQGAQDWAVIGADDPYCARVCTELTAAGGRQVAPISAGQALGSGVCMVGGRLYDALSGRAQQVLEQADAPALPGRHNAQNIAAAYAAARALGLSARAIADAVATFPGLEHRLERAGVIHGVRFINDSKATNADAAAQALSVYPRIYWIAGGQAKEGGIESLSRLMPNVAKAYLIGEAAHDFAATLEGKAATAVVGDLEMATRRAFADAVASREPDPVVLLSPACASFDQFKDFEDRGRAFKAIVAKLKAEGETMPRANGSSA
jgi:UDP-N-acetylmuramoylalanine--D-glutamate ligase